MSKEKSANYYKKRFFISESDIEEIKTLGRVVLGDIQEVFVKFYAWFEQSEEFKSYVSGSDMNRMQEAHWHYWSAFFQGDINDEYIQKRKESGRMYADIGLPLELYYTTIIAFRNFFEDTFEELEIDSFKSLRAFNKLANMDAAIAVATYTSIINETIQEQNEALMEMSTPVTRLWNDILVLPLVGIVDSKRAQDTMTSMLNEISATQSKSFILDISGIAMLDTAVANYLIKITKATKLMGCNCIISGISGAVAQTVIELGIDVGEVETTGNMQDALDKALRLTGAKITST